MKTLVRSLLLIFAASAAGLSAESSFTNPVLPGDHPDPSVIRVGREYWATATTSEWGPQFPILRSSDLVNWEEVGSVFMDRPEWAVGNFWAPEISEYKGRYYVYYVARKRGGPLAVAVASANHPAGPYRDHGPLVAQLAGSIDPVPVTDENGKRFLIWKEDGNSRRQPTILWAQPLSDDGTTLVGQMRELFRNDAPWEGAVVEGPFVVREDGWFYLFYSGSGCCGAGCNYAMGVARSKTLLGPWQKNPANPILSGNDDWKCPGHGSIVRDEKDRSWLLYHAYSAGTFIYTGREGLLDQVLFGTNGWPTIHEGKGPSAKIPLLTGASQMPRNVPFIEDFKGSTLRPGWQWPQDNKPGYQLGSSLKLAAVQGRTNDFVAAMLARFCISGNYTVGTIINPQKLQPGTAAGLAAVGDVANALGLAIRNGKLILWQSDRGKSRELAQSDLPASPKAHLRLSATSGQNFQFSVSSDGTNWMNIGDKLRGATLPPWDRSVRIALTVGGPASAEAVFDSFRMDSY